MHGRSFAEILFLAIFYQIKQIFKFAPKISKLRTNALFKVASRTEDSKSLPGS